MSARFSCAVAAAFVVILLAPSAAADPAPAETPTLPAPGRVPHLIMRAPRLLCKPAEGDQPAVCRDVPAGRFLDEPAWQTLDTEIRRLQTAETRLTAENKSLRGSLSTWQPGWRTMLVTFVVGAAAGVSGYLYLTR